MVSAHLFSLPSRKLNPGVVCIMHMKDEISSDRSSATSARDVIRREILDLEQRHNLGSRFVFLEQGMRVDF